MKNNKKWAAAQKRFDDSLPKLDNGNIDWETLQKTVSQNKGLIEMLAGKLPPQAIDIEKAVLGACLIDATGFKKAKNVFGGVKKPFYTDVHNAIWSAMENLNQKNEPIDRLTVFEALESMLKTGVLNDSPYYLSELTEQVSSSAHIESHTRILYQTHLRRSLINESIQLFQKATDPSTDLFEVMDEHLLSIHNLSQLNSILKVHSMPTVMDMAENATPKSFLVGSLIKKEDVTLLFSGTGNGKSVFSIQMADKISRGESLFDGLLRNDCGKQKVLYFDFELTLSDYKDRYIDGAGNKYPFLGEGWFDRLGNDEDDPKTFKEMASKMEQILTVNVENKQPNVIFVDNITAMSNGSTIDPEVVRRVMDLLLLLKKRYNLTVIVLAHTPKRYDTSKPLLVEDLAGSSLLSIYVDSIVTIGQSKMGEKIKYIKHIKVRSGAKIHDEQNVIQISIEKEGAFLQFKTLEEPTGRESDHLVSKYDAAIDEQLIKDMVLLKEDGKSLSQIKEELSLKISRQYIGQLIKAYQQKNTNSSVADFEDALKTPPSESDS
jgi:KaiC/GvpD/RAD55 family RecA-like ATPase